MMENAGRDELRDGRAGWLTGRVLRRRYHSSSHDAITYPSRPPHPAAPLQPVPLAFDIRGPEGLRSIDLTYFS